MDVKISSGSNIMFNTEHGKPCDKKKWLRSTKYGRDILQIETLSDWLQDQMTTYEKLGYSSVDGSILIEALNIKTTHLWWRGPFMKSSLPVTCAVEIKHKPQILDLLLWKRSLSCLSKRSEVDDEAANSPGADRRKDIKIRSLVETKCNSLFLILRCNE